MNAQTARQRDPVEGPQQLKVLIADDDTGNLLVFPKHVLIL